MIFISCNLVCHTTWYISYFLWLQAISQATNECTIIFYCLLSIEIPDFLTKEECEHIIRKATETGLALSEVKLPDEETTTDKFASKKLFNEGFCFFFFLICLFNKFHNRPIETTLSAPNIYFRNTERYLIENKTITYKYSYIRQTKLKPN